jgi:hypothetical protein
MVNPTEIDSSEVVRQTIAFMTDYCRQNNIPEEPECEAELNIDFLEVFVQIFFFSRLVSTVRHLF